MKKIGFFCGLLLSMAVVFSGCSKQGTETLVVPEEEQNFHWAVAAEDIEKIPYTLSGEKDGWKVLLQVRIGTEEEKEYLLQGLESNRATIEENYTVHHVMNEEQYQLSCEQNDKQKEDISQNDIYVTSMMGQYVGEQNITTEAEFITYQIMDQDGKIVITGGQDIQSLNVPWYLSYNTTSGEYAANVFVPPLEEATFILQYDDVEIEIPLVLEH